MSRSLYRICHGLAITVLVWSLGSLAASAQEQAQTPSSSTLAEMATRVPAGELVYVTDIAGTIVKGKLSSVTSDSVHLLSGAGPRQVSAGTIRHIGWQQRDSVLNGVLIGAGIGAIPGVYWLVVDPNECRGFCAEEYALIGLGSLAGGLIDCAIKRRLTVYSAAPSTRRTHVTIAPLVTRTEQAVQVRLTWQSQP